MRASGRLGVNLGAIDPGNVLARSVQCNLILRGTHDELMSRRSLQSLSQRSPLATYVDVPGQDHMTLPLRTDLLFQPVLAWMKALPVAPKACPGFSLSRSNQVAAGKLSAGSAAEAQPR